LYFFSNFFYIIFQALIMKEKLRKESFLKLRDNLKQIRYLSENRALEKKAKSQRTFYQERGMD